jgi:hypothetical protein
VAFGGATSSGGVAGTAVTLAKPAGTTTGDVLVAAVTGDGSPAATAPAGWASITRLAPSGATLFAWYRVVTAADAGTAGYTWTLSGAPKWSGGISRYTGVNTTTPLDGAVTTRVSSASASSVTVPGVVTTTAGAMVVGAEGADSGKVTGTVPSGWTADWHNNVGQLAASGHRVTTATGTQPATTWSHSGSVPMAAWTVALRPRPAG